MKIHAEKVDVRSIAELVPYARNSRTHSPAQIKQIEKSIQEFGWTVPVLVDEAGTIIAGHGRVMAASNLGIEAVPVVVAAGWTDDQKRAYIIADNKIASNADWDKDLLALELSDLKSADYDLGITGFEAKELVQYVAMEVGMPEMPIGEKASFQQMAFTLHDTQADLVREALKVAQRGGVEQDVNTNSNANSLAHICQAFMDANG